MMKATDTLHSKRRRFPRRVSISVRSAAATFSVVSGEATHEAGADGVRRAKTWLEATGRAQARWWVPRDDAKLTCSWHPNSKAKPFSFDMGGLLDGDPFEGDTFLAEVKHVNTVGGKQPAQYVEYLAKCYRAAIEKPDLSNHFMWITWHPFSQTKWTSLCTADAVTAAVKKHAAKALGDKDAVPESDLCQSVADRLWLIVLCRKQEGLVLSREQLALLARDRVIVSES